MCLYLYLFSIMYMICIGRITLALVQTFRLRLSNRRAYHTVPTTSSARPRHRELVPPRLWHPLRIPMGSQWFCWDLMAKYMWNLNSEPSGLWIWSYIFVLPELGVTQVTVQYYVSFGCWVCGFLSSVSPTDHSQWFTILSHQPSVIVINQP